MAKLTRRNFVEAGALAALVSFGSLAALADEAEGPEGTEPEEPDTTFVFEDADEVPLEDNMSISVAASPTPHAEILDGPVRELLEAQGYTLDVTEFTDYVLPNNVVEEGEIDANYFQHLPYLESFNEENGTHLVPVCQVHYEPFGIYPGRVATLDELSEGAQVAVPNDTTNEARALLLLEQEGLLTIDEEAGVTATTRDIIDNPLNLKFVELEAANIPNALPDVAIACINGNYALEAGFTTDDALAIEDPDGLAAQTYANVLVVHYGNENVPKIQALAEALNSEEVYNFILETYEGAVQPIFSIDDEEETEDADADSDLAPEDADAEPEGAPEE